VHPDDPFEQTSTEAETTDRPTDPASPERWSGRHRRRAGSRRRPTPLASTPVRVALATGVSCCLGVAAVAGLRSDAEPAGDPLRDSLADRAVAAAEAERRADRDLERSAAPSPAAPSPTLSASPSPRRSSTSPSPRPKKSTPPPRPRPVAGLTQTQMDNAKTIVDVGTELKMPRRAKVIAVATAMQESRLYNLASDVIPESRQYADQGSGSDHDSVGLFQQRPSSGWGTVRDLMRPAHSARLFYEGLARVPGWEQMSLTAAAQAVQISAHPSAYAPHEPMATRVVTALS
jgi:hypothetical protein